ncbi:membrane-bound O-acyltransferase family protein [Paramagnetospirillum kuznetsovii]|uniref:Probable alginate O-acetylase AlgI n=1 Tax=Paramagnetospirillum kuznetsovii TaxID=2053833 RepID=A0A364NXM5_9PROT|nr:MBOAT family O-acyltransferase [Paramagnetospirillum kuznetsovii]RAU21839.1 membrane-bound O-acyltransferase family protein [Paramagnetospirillum kuznetsovii]
MLFNSYEFLIGFLPLCLALTCAARRFGRLPALSILVLVSLGFYALWEAQYILLLLSSIFFNYLMGNLVHATRLRAVVLSGVLVNLAILGYFKYRIFFGELSGLHSAEALVVPLGISFYTFHQISFLIDVNRKNISPRGFSEYLLYVTFFPQLIAGPIVRFTEVIGQFKTASAFTPRAINFAVGFTMIAAGLFKKQILADTFAGYARPVFALAETSASVTMIESWTGILAYTLQIYFDFSGYSDMALGIARIFGIRLPVNFNSPYKATSIIDFWRRWHISLSRFLRDYLYVVIGGNRGGRIRRYINVMIVMLLGGLWHGADWTFVLWGGMHGGMLLINHAWRDLGGGKARHLRIPPAFAWFITFLGVMLAWTLFRAESVHGALNLWQGMLGINGRMALHDVDKQTLGDLGPILEAIGFHWINAEQVSRAFPTQTTFLWFAAGLFICLGLPNTQAWLRRYRPACSLVYGDLDARSVADFVSISLRWRPTVPWALLTAAMLIYAIFHFGNTSEFIYWQF